MRGGTRNATGGRQEATMPVVNMHDATAHLAELVRPASARCAVAWAAPDSSGYLDSQSTGERRPLE
jgi:hypothetical protein